MKNIKFGDMLSVKKGILVHGCNAQGVMGSGIAKQIREQYPNCYALYHNTLKKWHAAAEPVLGRCIVYEHSDDLIIVNAITQDGFGRDSGKRYVDYGAVQECFQEIGSLAAGGSLKDLHLHYPQIGAGLGGGDWSVINDIIDLRFSNMQYIHRNLWIYER